MNYQEITSLYRQIGRELREMGAEKVVLLSSRYAKDSQNDVMELELAVEGLIQDAQIHSYCQSYQPDIRIVITKVDLENHRIHDFLEDGIIL